jgi:hypothetical protein
MRHLETQAIETTGLPPNLASGDQRALDAIDAPRLPLSLPHRIPHQRDELFTVTVKRRAEIRLRPFINSTNRDQERLSASSAASRNRQ